MGNTKVELVRLVGCSITAASNGLVARREEQVTEHESQRHHNRRGEQDPQALSLRQSHGAIVSTVSLTLAFRRGARRDADLP